MMNRVQRCLGLGFFVLPEVESLRVQISEFVLKGGGLTELHIDNTNTVYHLPPCPLPSNCIISPATLAGLSAYSTVENVSHWNSVTSS